MLKGQLIDKHTFPKISRCQKDTKANQTIPKNVPSSNRRKRILIRTQIMSLRQKDIHSLKVSLCQNYRIFTRSQKKIPLTKNTTPNQKRPFVKRPLKRITKKCIFIKRKFNQIKNITKKSSYVIRTLKKNQIYSQKMSLNQKDTYEPNLSTPPLNV